MEKPKYILSGKCRVGDVGESTPLKDCEDKDLFVGDIVITSVIDKFGICSNYGVTAIVSDKWTTFSDGTNVEKEGEVEYFVMGNKNTDFKTSEEWIVKRVKSFEDIIVGENWKDYGFNYQ